jgi:hypothetical protein
MSAIPVEQIEPNHGETDDLQCISVRSTNGICAGTEVSCFTCGDRT